MSKFSFVVATILSMSVATAVAKAAPVTQRLQIASTSINIPGSNEIRDRHQSASGDSEHQATTSGVHADRSAVWDLEPESISRGTEP
jgi:hypothetical protein